MCMLPILSPFILILLPILLGLAVAEDYRRQGVASALIKQVEIWARSKN